MREIKFKYVVKAFYTKDKFRTVITKPFTIHEIEQNEDMYGFLWTICGNDIVNIEIVNRLQYAGLKDKNDKEIYDGDIVKIHLGRDDFEEKEIIYDGENCCFTFKNTHEDPHCQFSDHYQIIGNMHEPPK